MPDSFDRLTTIFQIQGLAQQVSGLQQVATAATAAAKPLNLLSLQTQALPGGFARLNIGNALAAGGFARIAGSALLAVAALRQVGQVMGEGMRIADEYNQALTRAVVLFGNAGRGGSSANLAGFARSRLFGAGVPETATLNLAGQLAERGFSTGRIGQLVPALQDIEAGTGGRVTAQRAMEMFLRVLERPQQGGGGGSRGILGLATQLGINIRFTGSIERDLQNLTQVIHEKFGGVQEALSLTASGTHMRVQTLATAALGRLGALIEASMIPLFSELIIQLKGFTVAVDYVLQGGGQERTNAFRAWAHVPGIIGLIAGSIGIARDQEAAYNQAAAKSGRRQMEDDIHKIMLSNERMAAAVATTVFGNIGSFTRGALAYRELNAALSVRT